LLARPSAAPYNARPFAQGPFRFSAKQRKEAQDAARLRRTWNRRDGIAPPAPKCFGALEAGQIIAFADFSLAGRATGLPLFCKFAFDVLLAERGVFGVFPGLTLSGRSEASIELR
jgi:hypothetical protein